MSQLAASDGQPGNWEEPDFSPRLLEIVRVQAYGWQEPCESRDSRTVLWECGGEIPLRDPTCRFLKVQKICDVLIVLIKVTEKFQLIIQDVDGSS